MFLLWSSLVLFMSTIQNISAETVALDINLKKAAHEVSPEFLSVTLDANQIRYGYRFIRFKSKKLNTLMRGLTCEGCEFYLRHGGTWQDHTYFEPSPAGYGIIPPDPRIYVLNTTMLDDLYSFTNRYGWKLIIGLNALMRKPDGSWDSKNARSLIKHALRKGYKIHYELGNEPDLYRPHAGVYVAPEQLGKDFDTLRKILQDLTGGKSKVIGPDISTPMWQNNYFERLLRAVPTGVLDAVTVHQYYSSSEGVSASDFTHVEYLDLLQVKMNKFKDIINNSYNNRKQTPIWIGETSSTYGGGAPELGESFAAGYLWLDKLGLAAQMNFSVVLRQTLKGGFYSLIKKGTWDDEPNPDMWISMIYKRIVGQRVLYLSGFLEYGRSIRVYAHCISISSKKIYGSNAIALIALNTKNDGAELVFTNPHLRNAEVDQFLFTSAFGRLTDLYIRMNGQIMKLVDDTTLPNMEPMVVRAPLYLPPKSYGIFVLKNIPAPACHY